MQALVGKGLGRRVVGEKPLINVLKANRGSRVHVALPRGVTSRWSTNKGLRWHGRVVKSSEWEAGEALGQNEMKPTVLALVATCTTSRARVTPLKSSFKTRRTYMTQTSGGNEAKEGNEAKAKDFGATPAAESKKTIDQFREGMRRDQGRLSMEADEVKQGVPTETTTTGSPRATLSTGPNASNTSSTSSTSAKSEVTAPKKTRKSGRAFIFVILILGMGAGFVAFNQVGDWIDGYEGGEEKKKDWSDFSRLPSNLASTIATWDDRMVELAMSSSLVQEVREKLGLNKPVDASRMEGLSTASASKSTHNPTDDDLRMNAAIVLEARKDLEQVVMEGEKSKDDLSVHQKDVQTIGEKDLKDGKQVEEMKSNDHQKSNDPQNLALDESSSAFSFNESYETSKKEEGIMIDESSQSSSQSSQSSQSSSQSPDASDYLSAIPPNIELLTIENEEMRVVLVELVRKLEEERKYYEEEKAKAVAEAKKEVEQVYEGKLKVLREDEAKRVLEILKAYEVKLEEDVTSVVAKAMAREEQLKEDYAQHVDASLTHLQASYATKLDEWSVALSDHVNKWNDSLLRGPVAEVTLEMKDSHLQRLSYIQDINASLDSRVHLLSTYQQVAQEAVAYAKVAKAWIVLQTKLEKAPHAPFYLQLSEYMTACQAIPQLKTLLGSELKEGQQVDLSSASASSPSSALHSLIKSSQQGLPSATELKQEFHEAARASRTATLAPQDANAFQHSWASFKEMFISSTSIGAPHTSNHIQTGETEASTLKASPSPASIPPASSPSSPSSEDASLEVSSKNWALLQKAGALVDLDSFGPALDVLSQLDGTPASLMLPWMTKTRQSVLAQSSLDFLGAQTANHSFADAPVLPPTPTL